MNFSFIIPMLNEEGNIGRCLESLCNLKFAKDDYEVIVVDNGSTDKSCAIVESFADRINVKVMVLPDVNISALRNAGVSKAAGDILGFIDADCTVPQDWPVNARYFADNPEIGAIGCTYTVPDDASWVARTWDINNDIRRIEGEVKFVPSGGLLVCKKDYLKIKGFDENLATSEDCDFCYRLKSSGKKVWSVPDAAAVHWGVSKNLWGFFKRQRWHGKHVLKVFFQDVRSLNNLNAAIYALYYLFVLSLGVVGGLFIYYFAGNFIWLLISALALIIPPALLSFRSLLPSRRHLLGGGTFIKLWLLYLVYGIARASSICSVGR